MHKRLFSVASFTAVVGAFAAAGACSSTTTIVVSGDGGPDASRKSSSTNPPGTPPPGTPPPGTTPPPPPPGDDGGGDDGGGGGTCPDTTPITSADIDSQIGWKPPAAIQDVCTKANIASLKSAFDNPANATYDDIIKDISSSIGAGACLNCIVTPKTASSWGPLVQDPMAGSLPNFGACYAGFPGSNAACGKANEYLEVCVLTACQDCADQTSFDACTSSKGIATACADPISTLQSACSSVTGISDQTSPINTACGDLIDGASTLCHGGIYDGG